MGYLAGWTDQSNNSIAMGQRAGQNSQSYNSIAMGQQAGQNSQSSNSIAMGYRAGWTGQSYDSIALGEEAGRYNQANNSIAMGYQAGWTGQSNNSIALGAYAGWTGQSNNSIAMGYQAAYQNQGSNSIALGKNAGYQDQSANSIIINATGNILNSDTSGCYIKPIRNLSQSNALFYDPSRGEITYNTPSGGTSYWDTSNNNIYNNNSGNVGIGITIPQATLDVSGNIQCFTITTLGVNNGSDYRIKEDVKELDNTFTVDKLRPVIYKNTKTGKQDMGFIAHELQEIFPFLVTGEKDGEELQTINYISLIPLLIKEIQELKSTLSTLSTFRKGGAKP